ncbi:MAG: ABC transporter permease [Anaerolineales bacterium]|nr:ABC transporter permease [Anaerolineales bacterium]
MRTLDLMFKDLAQIVRDRRSLVFLLVMPIVFTGFMGFALRAPEPADPRLPFGLVIEDQGVLGQALPELAAASPALRVVASAPGGLEAQVSRGDLAAALVLPADFSRQAAAGDPPALTLIADTLTPAGQTARQAAQGVVMRLLSAAQIARQATAAGTYATDAERQAAWDAAVTAAVAEWLKAGVALDVQRAAAPEAPARPVAFTQSSPGMLVMFALFGLNNSALVLVLERKTRTLQRMLTTTLRPAAIIAGHLLAMFAVVMLQGLILVLVGQFGFGVDYLRDPLATAVMLTAWAVWVASLGLLISAVVKNEDQVNLYALIAMFIFSALGGAWFPLEGVGSAFAAVSQWIPSAWAMTGFQNIVVRGLDVNSVLLPAGILLAYAAGFFGLAVWRFRFE